MDSVDSTEYRMRVRLYKSIITAATIFLTRVGTILSLLILPLFLVQFLFFQYRWLSLDISWQFLIDIFSQKTLFHIAEVIQRIFHEEQLYDIDKETLICTPNTWFAASQSKLTHIRIGTKICQRNNTNDADKDLANRALANLIEGFKFNKRFAPGVYVGLSTIEPVNETTIRRSRIIFHPMKWNMKTGKYAVVMRWLDPAWRLDNWLRSTTDPLVKEQDIKFLAQEIAYMHKRIKKSPLGSGSPEVIQEKLEFNFKRLEEAIRELTDEEANLNQIWLRKILYDACNLLSQEKIFEQRQKSGQIRRCHGDLKASNLWLYPGRRMFRRRLLALDCIDFRPDFYHIDKLSDIAMLAVDIQAHEIASANEYRGKSLTETLLYEYCQEMSENEENARLLLRYYMTEKAIACAYVSILFDNAHQEGRNYLSLAYHYAKELEEALKQILQQKRIRNQHTIEEIPSNPLTVPLVHSS
jgi:aminoglycoside phosphotransferase family enzyme